MTHAIGEIRLIEQMTRDFQRSSLQLNTLQSSDAEIIRLAAGGETLIAVTTDSIAEEIAVGLYKDYYLAGWMTVMANVSDLAAVGAQPIGLVVSEILPHTIGSDSLADLQRGLSDACSACSTYILGGDTNFGQSLILTGCAVGMFPGGRYLSRAGCREGDILYATGLLGAGNAFAASLLLANARSEFRPTARCKEGQALCGLATSCMDTSDGVLATLDQLMRVNNIGFELNGEWPEVLTPRAREISCNYGFPPWFMLAGHHGEFELLFTVPQEREDELMSRATEIAWEPVRLGNVIKRSECLLPLNGEMRVIDTQRIRNISFHTDGNICEYLNELRTIDNELQKGRIDHERQ